MFKMKCHSGNTPKREGRETRKRAVQYDFIFPESEQKKHSFGNASGDKL